MIDVPKFNLQAGTNLLARIHAKLSRKLYGSDFLLIVKHPADESSTLVGNTGRDGIRELLNDGLFILDRAEAMAEAKDAGPAQ